MVKVKDLPLGSHVRVDVKCDNCNKITNMQYRDYIKINHNNITYCQKCANLILNSGMNHYNWNPNISEEEREIKRNYKEYKDFIKKVMSRDNYTCQCCGKSSIGHHENIEVHHLDGYDWCVEKRTNDTNGITLCHECHSKFHFKYGKGNNTKQQFEEWIGKPINLLYSDFIPKEIMIYCCEENKIYEIDDFCKQKKCKRHHLISVCNISNTRNKSIKNVHVMFLDDYNKMSKKEREEYIISIKNKRYQAVRCIETGEIFESISEAVKKYNFSNASGICNCCKNRQKTAGGFHWEYTKTTD